MSARKPAAPPIPDDPAARLASAEAMHAAAMAGEPDPWAKVDAKIAGLADDVGLLLVATDPRRSASEREAARLALPARRGNGGEHQGTGRK